MMTPSTMPQSEAQSSRAMPLAPYVSYAQNFEDVYLSRIFGGDEAGFYIDVGACHPVFDSVTKHFYDRGWSGINIDASPYYFELLRNARTRDVNLNLAIGEQISEVDFFEVKGSGYSSMGEEVIGRARTAGVQAAKITVPMRPLQDVIDEYAKNRTISFLKVDVEGFELNVLKSIDLQKTRPRIIVVEAIHPDTREPTWDAFEDLVLSNGYRVALFDGLNRYYVACEHEQDIARLQVPINIFDHFTLNDHHSMAKRRSAMLKTLLKSVLPEKSYQFIRSRYRALMEKQA
jgi:FkbM family methyltransferase